MRRTTALLLGLVALAAGCARNTPEQRRGDGAEASQAGPILPEQAPALLSAPDDLLIAGRHPHKTDLTHAVYTHAEPAACPFMVAEESPILPEGPLAQNSAWWTTDGAHLLIEVAAVYPRGFDAPGALAKARARLSACYGRQATALTDNGQGSKGTFQRGPEAGTPNAQLWSWGTAGQWTCEYALLAHYNAAVLAASCEQRSTFDLGALVLAKERQLDQLARPQV